MTILFKLWYVFTKIGIFNFGGGYAVMSLIQNEMVEKTGWMSAAEFTDIVAISQMTPGPIGINCATYAGYTAAMNSVEGGSVLLGIIGSIVATFSLISLPFLLMLLVSNFLTKHREHPSVKDIFSALRPAIVGLILAASVLLLSKENFGDYPHWSNIVGDGLAQLWVEYKQFFVSIVIFAGAFIASKWYKVNPILLMCIGGVIGYVVYDLLG